MSRSSPIFFSNYQRITKLFPCQLVLVYAWSKFCMSTAEDSSLRFFATMHVQNQVLRNFFGGTFSDSFQQKRSLCSHCHYGLQSTSCHFRRFFAFLSKLFTDPMPWNLAFLGISVKIKLPAKFCLHSFEWFSLQICSDAKYFSLLSKALWSRINSCYSILFSNLQTKKEHNVISSRVISSHMGSLSIVNN